MASTSEEESSEMNESIQEAIHELEDKVAPKQKNALKNQSLKKPD
jgi:hypothetical protein